MKTIHFGLVVFGTIGTMLCYFGTVQANDKGAGLLTNLGTGLIGTVLTYLFVERLLMRKEQQQARILELEGRLRGEFVPKAVRQIAASELARLGKLKGADLRALDFSGLNLQDIVFDFSLLDRANFFGADLRGASMEWCSVKGCDFRGAVLCNVKIRGTSLETADTTGALS